MDALSGGLVGALGKQLAPFTNLPPPIRLYGNGGLSGVGERFEIHAKLTLLPLL
jgi:hypothetical protein